MAGLEVGQDVMDSPAQTGNEPTENPPTSLDEVGVGDDSQSIKGHDVANDMQALTLDNNEGQISNAGNPILRDQDESNCQELNAVAQKQQEMGYCGQGNCQPAGARCPDGFFDETCVKRNLKIGDIEPSVYRRILKWLSPSYAVGKDWKILAGKLGYNYKETKEFQSTKDDHVENADAMLTDWCTASRDHDLDELLKHVIDMKRQDIAELLKGEIDRLRLAEGCNCVDCGSIN